MSRYYARSASDKTDNWPAWYVADSARGGLNVTGNLIRKHINPLHRGGVFLSGWDAVKLAIKSNRAELEETAQ